MDESTGHLGEPVHDIVTDWLHVIDGLDVYAD